MNISNLKKSLPHLMAERIPVLIHGFHGLGKTEVIETFAKDNNLQIEIRHLGQAGDTGDLIGLPDLSGDATKFKAPDWLPRDPESKGIIFLDEFNRARPDIRQAMFEFVLTGKLGPNYQLPKGWYVLGAVNPDTNNYSTVKFKDMASDDRFLHLKFTPTTEEWLSYARNDKKAEQSFIDFLSINDNFIDTPKMTEFTLPVLTSRRSNSKAARLLTRINNELPEDVTRELLAGLVGWEISAAYFTYLVENDVKPFKPEELLGDFSKIEKRIKKYASFVDGRQDVLNASLGALKEYIKNYDGEYTQEQYTCFLEVQKALPKDLLMGFLKADLAPDIDDNVRKFFEFFILPDDNNSLLGFTEEVQNEMLKEET